MTLVIELEQCFESVAQVDRRAHSSWSSLSNEWRLRKIDSNRDADGVRCRGASLTQKKKCPAHSTPGGVGVSSSAKRSSSHSVMMPEFLIDHET